MKTTESNYLLRLTENYDKLLLQILRDELKSHKPAKDRWGLLYSQIFGPSPTFKRN